MNNPIRFIDPDGMAVEDIAVGTRYTGLDAQNMFSQLQGQFGNSRNSNGENGPGDKGKKKDEVYHPVPDEYKKEGLPGFPGSKELPRQKGARTSWDLGKTSPGGDPDRKIPKGWWGEWDSKRPEIEVYDKQGKHQGAYDPETGKFRKDSEEPGRKPTYDRTSSEEPDAGRTITQKGFEFPKVASPSSGTAVRVSGMAATLTVIAFILMLAGG